MKRKLFVLLTILGLFSVLLGPGMAFAQGPQPPTPEPPFPSGGKGEAGGPQQGPDGTWYMPEGARAMAPDHGVVPLASGGPDDFGYTWDDAVPYNWIDASAGTNTLLSTYEETGPISLGFTFSFYENNYTDIYIGSVGAAGFDPVGLNGLYPVPVPSPKHPNAFMAPFFSPPLRFNAGGTYTGTVYYLQGGNAPNRYFVVEWYKGYDYTNGPYTFEAILYENGNIDFSYQSMTQTNYIQCDPPTGVAIENAYGDDGLPYIQTGCQYVSSLTGKTVRFIRPTPSARAQASPKFQGTLSRLGGETAFKVFVRNTGDLGADTYDITTASTWPVSLYAADGTTALTDTDLDGTVDTGSVAQGDTVTITVKVTSPAGATVGNANSAAITVRSSRDTSKSKTVTSQTAVPAPFAQVYRDNADGAMSLYLVQPNAQTVKKATADAYYGGEVAVAEMPDSFAYFWTKYSNVGPSVYVREIEYTLLDRYGNTVLPVTKLTDNSGETMKTDDNSPAVAVAPDGRIGVLWYRYIWNSSISKFNYNIYYAILNSSGSVIYGPTNLTSNTAWGSWNALNVPSYYNSTLSATDDNRFVLAWETYTSVAPSGGCSSNCFVSDIYYTILDSNGSTVKPITKFTSSVAGGPSFGSPSLTTLRNSRALLTYLRWPNSSFTTNSVVYAALDSAGNQTKGETVAGSDGYGPVVTQLSGGQVVLAWHARVSPYTSIQFAVLDTALVLAVGPMTLANPVALPNNSGWIGNSLSAVADNGGYVVLTWGDTAIRDRPNLYYALVDSAGNVLTPPMIFRTSKASSPYIETSDAGYGNTSYSWTPPSGVDGVAAFSASLFGGTPGGNAAVSVRYANHGATTATGVVLTATLDSNLTYVSDTSGIVPTVSGNDVVWSLPDLGFLDSQDFTLYVQVPSGAAYGTRYPVTLTLTSDGPEANAGDNTNSAEVMAARQVFLPLIMR